MMAYWVFSDTLTVILLSDVRIVKKNASEVLSKKSNMKYFYQEIKSKKLTELV